MWEEDLGRRWHWWEEGNELEYSQVRNCQGMEQQEKSLWGLSFDDEIRNKIKDDY